MPKLSCQRAASRTSAVVLRQIQSGFFESSVRRLQNGIDNVFICVNFEKKTLMASFRQGRSYRNAPFSVKGQRIDRMTDRITVLTAARTAGNSSVCTARKIKFAGDRSSSREASISTYFLSQPFPE